MYGFLIVRNDHSGFMLKGGKTYANDSYKFMYHPLPKFDKDKLFYKDSAKIVLLDGAITNIDELMARYAAADWRACFELLLNEHPVDFMNYLRGPFCGAIGYNDGRMVAFTNHLGDKTVYFSKKEDEFIVSSHCEFIYQYLKKFGKKLQPCIQSMYDLMVNGAIVYGKSPFRDIYRLTAGRRLVGGVGGVKSEYYHVFKNIPEHDLSLDACIEKGDALFRKAVDRIFRKNKEYGYEMECDLSGGLDTRMSAWVAHDLGYKNCLNICYSRENSTDHYTSQKLAKDLGNKYFFLPMDSGIMEDVDKKVRLFGGQVEYAISSGSVKALETVGYERIGICCMSLLGEIQNAYHVIGESHTEPDFLVHSWRKCNCNEIKIPYWYRKDYDNYEQMNFYEYAIAAIMTSASGRSQYCEAASPFADVDYLDFIFKVPLKYRRHYFYVKNWMKKKYPGAMKYKWQLTGQPVGAEQNPVYKGLHYAKVIMDLAIRKFNDFMYKKDIHFAIMQKKDMGPVNKWYATSKSFRNYLQAYFDENIGRVQDDKLREDLTRQFQDGFGVGKIEVINVLGIYKRYIG